MVLDFNNSNHTIVRSLIGLSVFVQFSAFDKKEVLQIENGNTFTHTITNDTTKETINATISFINWDLAIERSSSELEVELLQTYVAGTDPYGLMTTATSTSSTIVASDWNTLKTNINAERNRRQKGAAPIKSTVTATPTQGNPITADLYNNFAAPLAEANSLMLSVTAGDYVMGSGTILADGMGSYTYLQNALNVLTGYTDVTSVSTGCQSSCTGLCSGACSGGCTGCTSCSGGCSGCTGCSTGCGTGCQTACTGCTNSCSGGCGNTCSHTCGGNCTKTCGAACSATCGGNCTKTCGGNCTYSCGATCTGCTGCSSGCSGCQGCSTGCQSCGSGCAGGCGTSCTGCSGSCGSGCSSGCGDGCSDGFAPYE